MCVGEEGAYRYALVLLPSLSSEGEAARTIKLSVNLQTWVF